MLRKWQKIVRGEAVILLKSRTAELVYQDPADAWSRYASGLSRNKDLRRQLQVIRPLVMQTLWTFEAAGELQFEDRRTG